MDLKLKNAAVGLLAACLLGGCQYTPAQTTPPRQGQSMAATAAQSSSPSPVTIPKTPLPTKTAEPREPYRAIAYVTVPASDNWRWIGTDGPGDNDAVSAVDTRYVTHINFAFGMIKAYQFEPGKPGCPLKAGRIASMEAYRDPADGQHHYTATLTGWIEEMDKSVDGREYVRALVALKEQKPGLKVLVSIGGWDSDGFCYMARTQEGRAEFIESCLLMMEDYGLDGIDLDWEYPTSGAWGEIASCEHCVEDARALLLAFRQALDRRFPREEKLLTIASGSGQSWVDGKTLDALSYINVMCYDSNPGSGGSQAGMDVIKPGMASHIAMVGDTPQNRKKLNLGLPFYNEGGVHLAPYYKGWDGHVDASAPLVEQKMNWVKDEGYGGGFYWAYSMDVFPQDVDDPDDPQVKILQRTLYDTLMG